MPLTLTIRNANHLANGSPLSMTFDRRGATIGRDPTTDWCLPDPSLHISSRHCEIVFRDDGYVLNDISTNGTFLNGATARLPSPHLLRHGDVLTIGHFEVSAMLDGQATSPAVASQTAPASPPTWKGWERNSGDASPPAPPASQPQWDALPPSAAISGTGPMSQSWAPPKADPPAPNADASSVWATPAPAATPASGWSSPIASAPHPPSANDVWGKVAESNVVDWARGGFGSTVEPPLSALAAAPTAKDVPHIATASKDSSNGLTDILRAMGLNPQDMKQDEVASLSQAGQILRRIVSGLVVMLEARARAKSQMGAQGTSLEFDGNNPLKFARTPEQALAQLLNPPERGFMPADRAIEDAFRDLQAHQMATLKAMQGALRSTLDRFSPTAIRTRAKKKGGLSKILPGSRDAALWKTYEREFSGVAQGSDEAFMDIFAKEFRKAYEEVSRQ
jgi:type VI secretion system protein